MSLCLYFLRHGQAGERSEWRGDDSQRPLTSRGKELMAQEAETLANMDLDLSLIITSPLTRCFQTAEIVARKLKMTDRLLTDDRLSPGFDVEKLAKTLQAHPEAVNVMLVGHEPDFSEAVSDLTGGGYVVMKKGALARVDLLPGSDNPGKGPLHGDLVWLIPPKALTK
jgi:phosphohistidine phosphatase